VQMWDIDLERPEQTATGAQKYRETGRNEYCRTEKLLLDDI